PELYDLEHDAAEAKNLYQPWEPKVQQLRGELAGFREKYPAVANGSAPVAQSTLDELQALGYLPKTRGATTAPEPSLLPAAKAKIPFQTLLHTAMLKQESHDLAAARSALEEALRLEPESSAALAQLGSVELKLGELEPAITHLRHALAANPENAGAARDL